MSHRKPVYLLAGGGPRNPSSMVHALARALQDCGTVKPKVAYLGVASKDNVVFYKLIQTLLKAAGASEVILLHLAKPGADISAAKKGLESADVIFISGGEVEDGMRLLKQHGLVDYLTELYNQGKLFLGLSAGSIMLGTHWVRWTDPNNDDTAELFDCLGLVPAIFDTHAEDEDWVELKKTLHLMGPGTRGYGIPRDGMISADSQGQLTNLEKEWLCFINDHGQVIRI